MARTTPTPIARPWRERPVERVPWGLKLALAAVAVAVAVGIAVPLTLELGAAEGADHMARSLLALDSTRGDSTTVREAAWTSGTHLVTFAAIATATAAAVSLLLGAVLLLQDRPGAGRTWGRLFSVGFWIGLVVCLTALLPGGGLLMSAEAGSGRVWLLAVAGLCGLLLNSVASTLVAARS